MRWFIFGIVALCVAVTPAQARVAGQGQLKKVSITSAPEGAFTATGHVLCASGQTATTYNYVVNSLDDGADLVVGKRFTCDDGSGTFDMVLFVRIRFAGDAFTDNFRWLVTGGTGQYADLQGYGTGVGTVTDGVLTDHYEGHIGVPNDG